jgi:hypothetical protein
MWRSSFVSEVKRDFESLTDYGFLSDHMTKGFLAAKNKVASLIFFFFFAIVLG